MRPTRSYQVGLLLIIVAYLAIGVIYALSTPPLEASDEFKHYPLVQYVQTHHALPVLEPDAPGPWLQEGTQPPLYYLVMAALTSWIDTSDLPGLRVLNPHAFIGIPNQVGNKNLIMHQPEREAFPWRGSVLAVYLIRLASIGLGAGTVWLTARLGRTLLGDRVGLLAAAFTAFNPMFLFVSAAVNNDSLAILLGTLGLYLLVRIWQDAPDPRSHWWWYAGLGVVMGLAMLTKLSLGGLAGLVAVALAVLGWRRQSWRWLCAAGVLVLGMALAVSGWWFARNLRLYGDLTGLTAFIAVQGTRDTPMVWQDWVGEFGTFYRSYWGLFGAVNVPAPEVFYTGCNVAALIGVVGFALWSWRRRAKVPGAIGLLVAWAAVLSALLIRWTMISPAFQGRLLFPALSALNVLWAVGWMAWVKEPWQPRLARALSGLMLLAAAALPWISIRPAYAYPTPLTAVPEAARFGPISFDADTGQLQLVGVEVPSNSNLVPGGAPLEVVLYWQCTGTVSHDYVSTVHLLGRNLDSVGQINRYPAAGMIPTSRWHAGEIWRDVYHVYVRADAVAPARLLISVGLYDAEAERALEPKGPDGLPMGMVIMGQARLSAGAAPPLPPPVSLEAPLADSVTLAGYGMEPQPAAPGGDVALVLYWRAVGSPVYDYTVFVHLLGADGSQVAGADGPPVGGDYPTSFWRTGDQVDDRHVLSLPVSLPPGTYQLVVGLYDPQTGLRVPRLDGGGDAMQWPLEVR